MKWLTLLAFLALPAHASVNLGLRIDGTDSLCSGYTASVSGNTSVLTCVTSPITPGAPTNCAATVNSTSNVTFTSAGGAASLSVACSEVSGVTYNWSKNGTFGANTNRQWTDTLPSNGSSTTPVTYSYLVRPCIGVNCVTVPGSALVATVSPTSGAFTGTCPGFDNTYVLTMNWASPTRLYAPSMGSNDIIVVQFTTGSVSTTTSLPRITAAEYQSSPSSRTAALSATPCDLTTQATPGANSVGNSVFLGFAIGTGSGFGYYPVLSTGTTYYANIKNSPSATCTATGSCGMFVDLIKPGGL